MLIDAQAIHLRNATEAAGVVGSKEAAELIALISAFNKLIVYSGPGVQQMAKALTWGSTEVGKLILAKDRAAALEAAEGKQQQGLGAKTVF